MPGVPCPVLIAMSKIIPNIIIIQMWSWILLFTNWFYQKGTNPNDTQFVLHKTPWNDIFWCTMYNQFINNEKIDTLQGKKRWKMLTTRSRTMNKTFDAVVLGIIFGYRFTPACYILHFPTLISLADMWKDCGDNFNISIIHKMKYSAICVVFIRHFGGFSKYF